MELTLFLGQVFAENKKMLILIVEMKGRNQIIGRKTMKRQNQDFDQFVLAGFRLDCYETVHVELVCSIAGTV